MLGALIGALNNNVTALVDGGGFVLARTLAGSGRIRLRLSVWWSFLDSLLSRGAPLRDHDTMFSALSYSVFLLKSRVLIVGTHILLFDLTIGFGGALQRLVDLAVEIDPLHACVVLVSLYNIVSIIGLELLDNFPSPVLV